MESKKKLTYILHNIAVGGVEVALISALPALSRKYVLQVIVLGTIDQEMTEHLSQDEKETFVEFNYPLFLYPLVLPKIVRHVLRFHPDIMICSLWRAQIAGICVGLFNKKVKFFSFIHNTRFPHFFAAIFTRLAGKKAAVILADSTATKEFIKREINLQKDVKVVSFLTSPTPKSIQREIPDIGQEVRFMFLGRISRVKNLPLIVQVLKDLRDRSVHCTLDIYGKNHGNETETLAALNAAGLSDHIRFMGEVSGEKKLRLFSQYHFYIQLSSYEGMAMSVAESMQHGLVCIVSPVGEIVHYAVDMKSAIFFDIFNSENWDTSVDKILNVLKNKNLYSEISQNCHQNFLNKKQYADSLIEQIESL